MKKLAKVNYVIGFDLGETCKKLGCTVHEVEQYVGIKYNGRNIMHIRVNKNDQLLLDVRENYLSNSEKEYFNACVMNKCQWVMNCRAITTKAMTLMELLVVVLAKEIKLYTLYN